MLSNYYYYCCSPSTLTFSHRPSRSSFLRCSIAAATTKTSSPSPSLEPHLMVDYLTTSCGFSLDRATKVTSKLFSHLKSTDKPNSFFGFMRSHGFNDTQIRKIVSRYPQFLCSNLDKTIAPKFKCFHDIGFSTSDIVHLISSHPGLLQRDFQLNVLPKIQFWESLLGSRDNFVNLFKRLHGWYLLYDPEKTVVPNISLLTEHCCISDERISFLLRKYPCLFVQKPEAMSAAMEHIERDLGVRRQSGMFPAILYYFLTTEKSNFEAKLKLMKSFGWSESEFLSAFCRAPGIVAYSEELLSEKMRFFVKEVGWEPSEVASYPLLLLFSLQGRLIPRHSVIKFLKARGLVRNKHKASTIMGCSDKKFMEKYVVPHMDEYPELLELYICEWL